MNEKIIKINKKEFNAISEIIGHIYSGTYENLFQGEMKEEGEINFTDDELAEALDGIIKKWFNIKSCCSGPLEYCKCEKSSKENEPIDDCWQCRAPMDFCTCTCDLCHKKLAYCNC